MTLSFIIFIPLIYFLASWFIKGNLIMTLNYLETGTLPYGTKGEGKKVKKSKLTEKITGVLSRSP